MSRSNWIVSSLPQHSVKPERSCSRTSTRRIPTRLILHFDINETILLGDDAGGDSRHDSLQKMLAKSAFVQLPQDSESDTTTWKKTQEVEPTHWWDGQAMGHETTIPPLYTGWEWPQNCAPYYRTAFKKFSKRFVDDYHGRIYRPVLDACEQALKQPNGADHILPAFYHTLEYLIQQAQPFRLVFRTFGSDIDELAHLVTEFARGKHPAYPHIRYPPLELTKDNLFQGRWKETGGDNGETPLIDYQLWNQEETKLVAAGDAEILDLLSEMTVCGIRDDYPYWKLHGWKPTAGKPVWIPRYCSSSNKGDSQENPLYDHHLLFDDNIHNLDDDGIACVRKQVTENGERSSNKEKHQSFLTLPGDQMHQESQGVHLVRVPTIEPVLNQNWYIEQIELARDELQSRLQAVDHQGLN